jgi:hypothetical protein
VTVWSNPQIGSKKWADKQLSFSIRILQGHICRSQWKGRLQLALIVRDRLREYGYSWHAERVDNWIHRCQPKNFRKFSFEEIKDSQDPAFQARELTQAPEAPDLSEREREEAS